MKVKMYRVLRNRKPIEDRIYYTRKEAEDRADALRLMLKKWDPKDIRNVTIQTIREKY